ncbi:MAG: triacylglycerol lipase, partial [Clostridiales bacterium]|nr:triacylglycerol lipase [Clostridiales bacterium]
MGDYKGLIVRFRNILLFTILMNIVFIFNLEFIKDKYLIIGTIFLSIFYLYINILPRKEKKLDATRLKIMVGGYELIFDSILSIIIEVIIYIILFSLKKWSIDIWIIIVNTIVSFIIIGFTFINGFFRVLFTSRQLSVLDRILLLFLWWMPIVNIILLRVWCKKVRYEYIYEVSKEEINRCRKENEICSTKYPIVLVHGIFFRDWMLVNYWGRIPKALITNGAKIYYGNQQ